MGNESVIKLKKKKHFSTPQSFTRPSLVVRVLSRASLISARPCCASMSNENEAPTGVGALAFATQLPGCGGGASAGARSPPSTLPLSQVDALADTELLTTQPQVEVVDSRLEGHGRRAEVRINGEEAGEGRRERRRQPARPFVHRALKGEKKKKKTLPHSSPPSPLFPPFPDLVLRLLPGRRRDPVALGGRPGGQPARVGRALGRLQRARPGGEPPAAAGRCACCARAAAARPRARLLCRPVA